MAYQDTAVPIARSQEQIRSMIYAHKGQAVNIISRRPREGFEALLMINSLSYHIRIMATCQDVSHDRRQRVRKALDYQKALANEEKRVWRVLFWHLKAMFEAADSGVIDIRDVILPYVVTRDGRTLSEHLVPRMPDLITMNPDRLLPSHVEAGTNSREPG